MGSPSNYPWIPQIPTSNYRIKWISTYGCDVFLSSCLEDVSNSFADHLYEALVKKGLHSFREPYDASESMMAIEKSKAIIIIFSRNYPHSTFLLNTLVEIHKCVQTTTKPVIPIFYHVDPSEVRNQSGSYGEAFEKHGTKHEKEKVDRWRTALTEASNLAGHELHPRGYESAFIKQITDHINGTLRRQHFGDDYLVGIDNPLEELKSLIYGIGVRMLGVYGIGGIGKTTITEALYSSIKCRFERVSFFRNGREQPVRKQPILEPHKKPLFDITKLEDANSSDENYGIFRTYQKNDEILKKLPRQKVLIVVDDMDCLSQLEDLVPDRKSLGDHGSKIIITTRDKRVLRECGVDAIYEVQGLNFEESMHLFCLYAFQQGFPKEGYEKLSQYVVDYVKGLPLALKVFGSFLHGRTISEWEKALDNQEPLHMKEIHDVLKISFDRLDSETKNIFLDITCFFQGEEKELVSKVLDGAEKAILTTLYDKSLLNFSNNKIVMHPLVQQMGQQIVCQESHGELGKQRRLWRSKDVYRVLSNNEGTDLIEGIFLKASASEPIEFTTEAFKMMNKLRLLKVCEDLKCGSGVKDYEVHVSTDFEFPSNELRYLHWDGFPLEYLPSNFHGENLVELNIQCSKLRGLWKGNKLLGKLKVITLSHCDQLIQIPDFSDTPNLESLILEGCTNLEEIPSSIWELDSLANLDLSHCSKLQKLPEIQWNLYSLEYLNLAFCKKLESLPKALCNLKCLKTLNIIGCSKLDRLPDSLGSLECLEKLCASNASLMRSQELPYSLTGLCSLKILDVHGTCLKQGEMISSDIGSLYSLEELDLSYCNLTEGGIPDDICCLYSLRVLDLSGNHFLRVTDAISQLSKLRVLGLRHCLNLLESPKLPSGLRVLDAHDCTSMKILSNTSTSPWQSQLNCFKSSALQEIQESRYRRLLSIPENGVSQGFSTIIPGNGEVPEWISYQSLGNEITALLPQDWYRDRVLSGFALCCVYAPQHGEPMVEPERSVSKDESDKESSENVAQPYRLGCELTFVDDTIRTLDYVFSGSSCPCDHDDGVSDSVWVTYYSTLAIKMKYCSDKASHLKASFSGYVDGKPVKVEKCGIGLVHVDP